MHRWFPPLHQREGGTTGRGGREVGAGRGVPLPGVPSVNLHLPPPSGINGVWSLGSPLRLSPGRCRRFPPTPGDFLIFPGAFQSGRFSGMHHSYTCNVRTTKDLVEKVPGPTVGHKDLGDSPRATDRRRGPPSVKDRSTV